MCYLVQNYHIKQNDNSQYKIVIVLIKISYTLFVHLVKCSVIEKVYRIPSLVVQHHAAHLAVEQVQSVHTLLLAHQTHFLE